jgi:hypothetical protein
VELLLADWLPHANDRIRITPSFGEFDRPIWDTTDEETFRAVASPVIGIKVRV